jgi:hypothetical protein
MKVQNKGSGALVWFFRLVILHRIQSCRQYALDCDGCIGSGCLYCPKDGHCSPGEIPQEFFLGSEDLACSSEDYRSVSCVAAADNVFNDLLYTEQSWVYDLIDVESVWRQGITGAGVHIRINDNGVNGDHPELSARFDKEGSCEIYLPYNLMENTHGTAMAAIAAGEANNDECSAGIAPGATVSSCVMVATSPSLLTPEASDGYFSFCRESSTLIFRPTLGASIFVNVFLFDEDVTECCKMSALSQMRMVNFISPVSIALQRNWP